MARIVFATIGSLGDLHPIIACALGLKARGHEVSIATGDSYGEKIRSLDLGFLSLRPDPLARMDAEIMDGARGLKRLMKGLIFPAVREMHADLAWGVAKT